MLRDSWNSRSRLDVNEEEQSKTKLSDALTMDRVMLSSSGQMFELHNGLVCCIGHLTKLPTLRLCYVVIIKIMLCCHH